MADYMDYPFFCDEKLGDRCLKQCDTCKTAQQRGRWEQPEVEKKLKSARSSAARTSDPVFFEHAMTLRNRYNNDELTGPQFLVELEKLHLRCAASATAATVLCKDQQQGRVCTNCAMIGRVVCRE